MPGRTEKAMGLRTPVTSAVGSRVGPGPPAAPGTERCWKVENIWKTTDVAWNSTYWKVCPDLIAGSGSISTLFNKSYMT